MFVEDELKRAEDYLNKVSSGLQEDKISDDDKEKQVYKIALTGGPCAGKTTALSKIQEYFSKMGYQVVIVPETATELILGGITPSNSEVLDFQNAVLKLQIAKENIFLNGAKKIKGAKKILLVCDRGVLDAKAYITQQEMNKLLEVNHLKENTIKNNYDAVFHLVTAANGAKDFYTKANNAARYESIEQAIECDKRTIYAWTGHPHLRVIDNSTGFEDKLKRLIAEISLVLGEPRPYEIERKFLIKMPDVIKLMSMYNANKSEIIQTYLLSNNSDEIRVRQSGTCGDYVYTKTTKKVVNAIKRIEVESKISKDEYLDLLMSADTTRKPVRKTRYRFFYKNQYFEIDVYKGVNDKAVLEIELNSENQQIDFPKSICVIQEVSGDSRFKNYNLAKNIDVLEK